MPMDGDMCTNPVATGGTGPGMGGLNCTYGTERCRCRRPGGGRGQGGDAAATEWSCNTINNMGGFTFGGNFGGGGFTFGGNFGGGGRPLGNGGNTNAGTGGASAGTGGASAGTGGASAGTGGEAP